jgi:3-hydroxyisobutyrate dehydrogenase
VIDRIVSQNIALLGLGTMGGGMASNLLKADLLKVGFSLTEYNRTAARAQPLISAGARLASSPAEAAKGAAILVSMLADDAASREIWTGENGALAAVTTGAILIECSTVSPHG